MLAYMNDATNPLNAYPALWAPFVVVGEGGWAACRCNAVESGWGHGETNSP
jgi:hypothetical protein